MMTQRTGTERRIALMMSLLAVDNQAAVISETVDAIRTPAGRERDAQASIERTNAALGIGGPV